MAQTWQQWVEANLPPGTRETSGYRSPQQEAALGGPSTSYHTRGTPEAPGAIDVGGPAAQLKALYDRIKQAFAGRINELYLNVPAGGSQDIKNNQSISYNPEAGRPQHLHIAIGGPDSPVETRQAPAPAETGTGAATVGECTRALCPPNLAVAINNALPDWAKGKPPEQHCYCWSDIWTYSAAIGLIIVGVLMMSRGESK